MRHTYRVEGWGVGELWVRDGILVQHELASEVLAAAAVARPDERAGADHPPRSDSPNGGVRVPARTLAAERRRNGADFVPELCRRFERHLAGVPTAYADVDLDLDWATPFQRELAAAARAVPWGEVVSYGELAALAGRPGAARAAGSFCAENRYSLIVPCHRIVAVDGIGGYGSSGVALKRRLLALEGIAL